MMEIDRFDRCRLLFDENFTKIQNANILLLGVGGVGGVCLDALYRTGVKHITIVDFDTFEITNQNRQIGSENLGDIKVNAMAKLYSDIDTLHVKITPDWVNEFDFDKFDLVIDAIDDMKAKVAVAHKCFHKLISSAGGAKKIDPTHIQVSSVWKTHTDGLAKKFRYELKRSDFDGDFEVVFSDELPQCKDMGSFIGVTGSFGLALASLAIKKIID